MKAISASIVVLAGAILIFGGVVARDDFLRLIVPIMGFMVGLIGLVTWFYSLKE